jgi:hypothetical protein
MLHAKNGFIAPRGVESGESAAGEILANESATPATPVFRRNRGSVFR